MKRTSSTLHMCFVAAVACVLLSACSSSPSRRGEQQFVSRSANGNLFVKMQAKEYLIRQGDNVELSVWGYTEFNTATTVNTAGMVLVPLVGEVRAAGLTKEEFVEQVKAKLSEYVQGEPRISMSVSSPLALKVSVLGAVTRQDNYPVMSDVPLMEVLSTAGGAAEGSDLRHVKIIRFGSTGDPIEVDVAYHLEAGMVDQMPRVRPGDTVFVPKQENFIRSFSDFLRDVVLLFGFFRVFG